MIEVPLTRGKVALIDDEDYERVSRYKWYAAKDSRSENWYAKTTLPTRNGKRTMLAMHHLICPPSPGMEIDHWDGDTLNNRRANLREATHRQNSCNRKLRADNTSGYRGVWRERSKWRATVMVDGRQKYIGTYTTAEEAARAYDAAAKAHYGEFCRPNFPEQHQ